MVSFFVPQPPDWKLDWQALHDEFAFVRALQGCAQEPSYHAEGDVWIHTRMVCEAVAASECWRALPEEEREIVFIAALMHDIAKPVCTRMEEGRITSRGHSSRGEVMARELAREHLRRKQSFIWNATNLSRQMRERSLSLCAAYNARLRIVYIEAPADRLFTKNAAREHSVPPTVIARMLEKWQPPDLTEAHQVEWVSQ